MLTVIYALGNYCSVHKRLPLAVVEDEDGTPLASWRMAVLMYSPAASTGPQDTQALDFTTFDLAQPWNARCNESITGRPIDFYCFGSAGTDDLIDTNVFGITGQGTAFDASVRQRLVDLPHDTIVLIEVSGTRVPWAAPGDWNIARSADRIADITAVDGFHVAFADGTVWHLRSEVPFAELEEFFLIDGARRRNRDRVLGPYRLD